MAALLAGWYALSGRYDHFLADDAAHCDCSMLAAQSIRAGGIEACPGVPASNLTPIDVERWACAIGA